MNCNASGGTGDEIIDFDFSKDAMQSSSLYYRIYYQGKSSLSTDALQGEFSFLCRGGLVAILHKVELGLKLVS